MEKLSAPKRQRTCIGCGKPAAKSDLKRIVRRPDGEVAFDAGGRAPGRGAYVCSAKCLIAAFDKQKVQRALRCAIGDEERQRVIDDAVRGFGALD